MDKIKLVLGSFFSFLFLFSCEKGNTHNFQDLQQEGYRLVYSQGITGFSFYLIEDSLKCNLPNSPILNSKLSLAQVDKNKLSNELYKRKLLKNLGNITIPTEEIISPKIETRIIVYKNNVVISSFTIPSNVDSNSLKGEFKNIVEFKNILQNILNKNENYNLKEKELKNYIIENKVFLL